MSAVAMTAILAIAEVFSMAGFSTFAALLPGFIDEWSLSNTDAGWINGIYFAGYLAAVPVLVSLTDRTAPRQVYFLSLMVGAASSLGFALMAEGFWTAMAFRTLAGVGLAGTYMPGLKMLSDRLEGRTRGRAVAFYTSSFGIGASLSFLFAGEVTALLDWHWTFAIAAVGPVISLILVFAFLPGDHPTHRVPDTHLLDFRPVLRCRAAMAYVLAYTMHNFELFTFRSWAVAYLVFAQSTRPEGTSAWSATVVAAIINLVGMPSSVIGNEFAERFGRHRVIIAVMITSIAIGVVVGFGAGAPFWMVVVLCLAYWWAITADSSAITAGVVAAAPEGYRGATMAVHSSVGFMGAFLGPLVFGIALDATGGGGTVASWGIAFTVIGVLSLAGPVLLRVLARQR